MKLNTLKPAEGSTKGRTRVGRGIGSGKGKTCGRGQKGQKARSGVAIKGFEGGQMPLDRRLPKFGFNNKRFATQLSEITTGRLQAAIDAKKLDPKKDIDEKTLLEAGVIRKIRHGVKIISKGGFSSKASFKVTKVSQGAKDAIEKAGGSVTLIDKAKPAEKEQKKADKK